MSDSTERLEKELRAWAANYSPFFAAQAIQAASSTRAFAELVTTEVGDAIQRDCTGRTDKDYRRYYLSIADFAAELPWDELAGEHGVDAGLVYFAARLKARDPEVIEGLVQFLTAPEFAEQRNQAIRAGVTACHANLEQVIKDATAGAPEPLSEKAYDRTRQLPSVTFLVRVFLPAIVETGRTPQALFAAATNAGNPDLDALNHLVNIDREIIHLPEVRAILEQPSRNASADNYSLGATALLKPLKPPTPLDVKQRAASYIWRLATYLDERVPAREIHRLFDILAQTNDSGLLIDPDFAELLDDSFRRMLSRNGEHWHEVLADKDLPQAVRALRKRVA